MKKLYMISLGGKAQGANIEVHDVQFVVADSIDATIPLVKEHWHGKPLKLHMDSYKEIVGAEGYSITLSSEPVQSSLKLYFVYLGGYHPESTQEIHEVRLLVGTSLSEVKARSNDDKLFQAELWHVDQVVEVNEALLTEEGEEVYIVLEKSGRDYDLKPDWFGYKRLDK